MSNFTQNWHKNLKISVIFESFGLAFADFGVHFDIFGSKMKPDNYSNKNSIEKLP